MKNLNLIVFIFLITSFSCKQEIKYTQPELGIRSVELLTIDGYQFEDMNKNGSLDPYENWRLSTDERVLDLIIQMTLEEKVGFMLISSTALNGGGSFGRGSGGGKITSDLSEKEV
jgi:beta-glucosidase